MMRLVIAALAGLLIGIGGGVAASWLRGPAVQPPAVAVADSAAAIDSVAFADSAGSIPGDTAACACNADSTSTPIVMRDSTRVAAVAQATATPARDTIADPVTAVTDSIRAQRERLVRIMGAMKPADAARALVPLDDAQVEAVLFGMSERKAAAILGSFPAERAASLMRSILSRRQR